MTRPTVTDDAGRRRFKRTADQIAAHKLANACRRLDTAIRSGDAVRAEKARAAVVEAMANMADEFGLVGLVKPIRAAVDLFASEPSDLEEPDQS